MNTYDIIILGNDEFCFVLDDYKADSFGNAFLKANELLSSLSNLTIEQLRIASIQEVS